MKRMSMLILVASCAHAQPVAAPAAPHDDKPTSAFDYVGGLALRAKQPKELAQWYTQRFGLDMKIEFPGGVAGGFKSGGVQFAMAIVDADGSHPGSSPGTGYFVLHVADFDGFLAGAATRGLTPFEKTADAMGRFASFRDPEGNEVSVWGK